MSVRAAVGVVLLGMVLGACGGGRGARREDPPVAPVFEELGVETAAALLPHGVKEPLGWAEDVLRALDEHRVGRAPHSVCAVFAVIEQESGFHADPVVQGLAGVVQKRLDAYAGKLGPLGSPMLHALLDGKAPGRKETFLQRLKVVRTERELDVIFRELLRHYEEKYPNAFLAADTLGGLFAATHLDDLNPVTTAGSMQVSVRWSVDLGRQHGRGAEQVRDELYTRPGGVWFGVARLLGYAAAYPDMKYRFADYNSGMYGSRNAALQSQLAELTGYKLVLDGDLLAYNRAGQPTGTETSTMKALKVFRARHARDLAESDLWRDARLEKSAELEGTPTWRAVRKVYEQKTGKAPAYAVMPRVTIHSPKMKQDRDTAWYARNVQRRHEACLKRHAQQPHHTPHTGPSARTASVAPPAG